MGNDNHRTVSTQATYRFDNTDFVVFINRSCGFIQYDNLVFLSNATQNVNHLFLSTGKRISENTYIGIQSLRQIFEYVFNFHFIHHLLYLFPCQVVAILNIFQYCCMEQFVVLIDITYFFIYDNK